MAVVVKCLCLLANIKITTLLLIEAKVVILIFRIYKEIILFDFC